MTQPDSNLEKLFQKYKSAYPAIEQFMMQMYQTDSDPLELAIFLNVLCGEQINRAMLEQGLSEGDISLIERTYVDEFSERQRQEKTPLMTQIIGLQKVLGISLLTMEQIRKMIDEGATNNEQRSTSIESTGDGPDRTEPVG